MDDGKECLWTEVPAMPSGSGTIVFRGCSGKTRGPIIVDECPVCFRHIKVVGNESSQAPTRNKFSTRNEDSVRLVKLKDVSGESFYLNPRVVSRIVPFKYEGPDPVSKIFLWDSIGAHFHVLGTIEEIDAKLTGMDVRD